MYGYRDQIVDLIFLDKPSRLYVLSDNTNGKYFSNLYVWNWQSMTPISTAGFQAPQAIGKMTEMY
jgi:hypothetical protein